MELSLILEVSPENGCKAIPGQDWERKDSYTDFDYEAVD
jgi:hypothetical protein